MKKISVVMVVGMIGLMLMAGSAMAADTAGKIGIGLELGYNQISDTSIPDAPGIDGEFDGAFIFGANADYFFTDFFSLEMFLGYTATDMDASGFGVSIDVGEVTQVPWTLTARLHYPNDSIVSPYIGAGVGYYFNDFDVSSTMVNNAAPQTYGIDLENSFGFHVNGGAEVFVDENVAFDLDLKYTWNNADWDENVNGVTITSGDIDMDAFTATVGVKYYF
ncbi:OmpW/AlkL family protein [Desulfatibacillum aliphaticivorans]|uniref:OmpW/AlkL family protein n=1 Tax=Desulfatibacillum aliphaticivorans TaxID=218208 RepID=UPI000402954E|nr:OmpW family outer membrane protein [Desulfatibacillum aliphaticivorans]